MPSDVDKTASAHEWMDVQPIRGTKHVMQVTGQPDKNRLKPDLHKIHD